MLLPLDFHFHLRRSLAADLRCFIGSWLRIDPFTAGAGCTCFADDLDWHFHISWLHPLGAIRDALGGN